MASYRHLRDVPSEALAPPQKPKYSKKEIRMNWWHYHWKIIVAISAAVLVVVWSVASVVLQQKPDIIIGIVSEGLPDALLEKLEEQLAAIVPDINKDGRVMVSIESYTIAFGEENIASMDPNMQMAGVTRLVGALSSGNSMIFLADNSIVQELNNQYALFGTLQGEQAPETANIEELVIGWEQSSFLSSLQLSFEMFTDETLDGQQVMQNFSIGIRAFAGSSLEREKDGEQTWQQIYAVFAALKS